MAVCETTTFRAATTFRATDKRESGFDYGEVFNEGI